MGLSHIPQYAIQNRNIHVSLLTDALCYTGHVHYVCDIGLYYIQWWCIKFPSVKDPPKDSSVEWSDDINRNVTIFISVMVHFLHLFVGDITGDYDSYISPQHPFINCRRSNPEQHHWICQTLFPYVFTGSPQLLWLWCVHFAAVGIFASFYQLPLQAAVRPKSQDDTFACVHHSVHHNWFPILRLSGNQYRGQLHLC